MVNKRGFSVTEVLIGIGISSLVLLILGGTIFMTMGQSQEVLERLEAEADLVRVETLFKDVMQVAVDVRPVNLAPLPPPNPPIPPANNEQGWFLQGYNSVAGGIMQTLGIFLRENRRFATVDPLPAAPFNTSEYFGTGVFYQPPSADGRQSGVLFVDLGNDIAAVNNLRPDYGDIHVGNIVDFRITNPLLGANNSLIIGFTVSVVIRYFIGRNFNNPRCFLLNPNHPNAAPAGFCGNLAMGHDIDRSFQITINNSDLGPSPFTNDLTVRERPTGRIYSFPLVMPTASRAAP